MARGGCCGRVPSPVPKLGERGATRGPQDGRHGAAGGPQHRMESAPGVPGVGWHPRALHQAGWRGPPFTTCRSGPVAGWGLPTCSRCSIKLQLPPSHQFPTAQRRCLTGGAAAAEPPPQALGPPRTSPMEVTALLPLLLVVLGAGETRGLVAPGAGGTSSWWELGWDLGVRGGNGVGRRGGGSPSWFCEQGPGGTP